jgi:TonB-dependent starch-binding outer membrane protein SusC
MKKNVRLTPILWKIMRFTINQIMIIAFFSCLAFGHNAKGQEVLLKKVSLKTENLEMRTVLRLIEKQANVKFMYSAKIIQANQKISLDIYSENLESVLKQMLTPLSISYEIFDNRILLKKKPTENSVTPTLSVSTPKAIKSEMEQTVKGIVTDVATGEGLPNASVVVKGTTQGVITDIDGTFSITVPDDKSVLIFSYVGYETKEVLVGSQTVVNIALSEGRALNEVVVVGYGTQRKSDVTGAVSKIDIEKAMAIPTTNIAEMLRGQAAGVQITLGSARPGGSSNILIRGRRSISGGNDPLVVLDGFPIDNINDINPDDIASLEVLKDAAAQAIYGARAANGVILVTTKKGKAGKMTVGFHSYYTTQKLTKNFELFSPEEFAQYRREAIRAINPGGINYSNDTVNFGGTSKAPEYINYKAGNFADWESALLRPALTNSNTISVSGGNENTKIFTSANYYTQTGLIPNSDYTRGAFRLNLNQKVTDKLSIEANLNLATDAQQKESSSLDFITISPFTGPRDVDGNLVFRLAGANASSSTINPLWNIAEAKNDVKTSFYNINVAGNYIFNKNFSYKLNTLYSRKFGDEGTYRTRLHSEAIASNGAATLNSNLWEEYLVENILNYNGQINSNNKIDITLVQSVNQKDFSNTFVSGTNFSNDILGYDGISNALNFKSTRAENRRRLVGYLGRVRYNLMDKYLLTVTARQDGASVFAESKKWGFFPAVAVAWKMHNEAFLKNVKGIDELKIRVSYGSVGNQALAPYQTLGLVGTNPYIFGGILQGGNLPGNSLPNPNLTWETSTTLNTGLDFGLFGNRIIGSVEYYDAHTTDLLTNIPLGGTSGFSSTITNGGETQNSGVELLLTGNIIRNSDLRWSITTTFTQNKNKLIKSGLVDDFGNPKDDISSGRFIGKGLNLINSKQFDGIFQTNEEALSSPQGTKGGTVTPFQPVATLHAGAIRVKDVNGDGIIDIKDDVIINADPQWYGSISTNVAFKGFELLADLYTVQGVTKYNPYLGQFNEGGYNTSVRNGIKRDYWTPENQSTTSPRPNFNTKASNIETMGVADASYVRLRTLSLSYNFPKSLLEKTHVSNLRLYITANNLVTITKYKSYSPENNPNDFPDTKGFTFGLNVGL